MPYEPGNCLTIYPRRNGCIGTINRIVSARLCFNLEHSSHFTADNSWLLTRELNFGSTTVHSRLKRHLRLADYSMNNPIAVQNLLSINHTFFFTHHLWTQDAYWWHAVNAFWSHQLQRDTAKMTSRDSLPVSRW